MRRRWHHEDVSRVTKPRTSLHQRKNAAHHTGPRTPAHLLLWCSRFLPANVVAYRDGTIGLCPVFDALQMPCRNLCWVSTSLQPRPLRLDATHARTTGLETLPGWPQRDRFARLGGRAHRPQDPGFATGAADANHGGASARSPSRQVALINPVPYLSVRLTSEKTWNGVGKKPCILLLIALPSHEKKSRCSKQALAKGVESSDVYSKTRHGNASDKDS